MAVPQSAHSEKAVNWLESAGVRPTRQRVTLASLLLREGIDRHVTAETLFEEARHMDETVSLATVYNALHLFRDAGLLREINADGQRSWFDTRVEEHPHFFWEDCGEISDAPSETLQLTGLPEPPKGTRISEVDVIIRLKSKR